MALGELENFLYQAMNALVFLYKHVLKHPLDQTINAERAPRRDTKHSTPMGDPGVTPISIMGG